MEILEASSVTQNIMKASTVWEMTNESESVNWELIKKYQNNMSVSTTAFYSLTFVYFIFILVGTVGNIVIIWAVISDRIMWNPRNFFIMHLSMWDLTLCLFTMPMTLNVILTKYWAFGFNTKYLCVINNTLPAINVYCSSFTIVVISLDRYWYIVHALKSQLNLKMSVVISVCIWILGVAFSLPLSLHAKLLKLFDDDGPLNYIVFCIDEMPSKWKITYSVCSTVIQYIVPGSIVTVAYAAISTRISSRCQRLQPTSQSSSSNSRYLEIERRCLKTNRMLMWITLTYFIAWLPLNAINILVDIFGFNIFSENEEAYLGTYAVCHLAGMSSACFNPIFYGVLNENFKNRFQKLKQTIFIWKNKTHEDAMEMNAIVNNDNRNV